MTKKVSLILGIIVALFVVAFIGVKLYQSKSKPLTQRLQESCKKGETTACTKLAKIYIDNGTKLYNQHKLLLASECFKKACDLNNAEGCVELGYLYAFSNSDSVKKDYSMALKLFKKACKLGEGAGCNDLGVIYVKGLSVNQDYSLAAKFYKQACDMGDDMGCKNLGVMYKNGEGVKKDYSMAVKLYKKACDLGNALGCYNLGYMYENGEEVKQDYSMALNLYKKACKNGDSWSCNKYKTLKSRIAYLKLWNILKLHMPFSYNCNYHSINGQVTETCGSFAIRYSDDDEYDFLIVGDFKSSLNSQIAFIANKMGVPVSQGLDLTDSFIKYLIDDIIPSSYWKSWKKISRKYIPKVIITAKAVNNLIKSGDVKDLNKLIEGYVKDALKGK